MLDGSDNAGSGRNACLSDTPSWIYQLLNLVHPSRTWFLLGIASHLSWFQCLSSIYIVKLTFNMSTQSSSKLHMYSYITINKKDQLYCYRNTVTIKAKKEYMCWLGHEGHYMLHPVQPISYVPSVPTASSTVLFHVIPVRSMVCALACMCVCFKH